MRRVTYMSIDVCIRIQSTTFHYCPELYAETGGGVGGDAFTGGVHRQHGEQDEEQRKRGCEQTCGSVNSPRGRRASAV